MTISVSRETASITPRQLELLHFLASRPRISVGDVATALGISSAAATKAITRLERKGLVARGIDIMDRRCVNVRLTGAGAEVARRSSSAE
jgi:DNA-binding MarR family transcriptional regulator